MSIFSGIASLISSGLSYAQGRSAQQQAIANQAQQQRQFDKNFALQQQQFAYHKDLQQEIFGREDNSVQRRVADMKKAGLSPVLAAGQGARAGEAIRVNAPQGQAATRSFEGQMMKQSALAQMAGTMAQISKTVAETKLINSQVEKTNVGIRREGQMADIESQRFGEEAAMIAEREPEIWRIVHSEVSEKEARAIHAQNVSGMSAVEYNFYLNAKQWIEAQTDPNKFNPVLNEYRASRFTRLIAKEDYGFVKKYGTRNIGLSQAPLAGITRLEEIIKSNKNAKTPAERKERWNKVEQWMDDFMETLIPRENK